MSSINLREFLRDKKSEFKLSLLNESTFLDREIDEKAVRRSGLLFVGHETSFPEDIIHVLGEVEIDYLNSLTSEEVTQALDNLQKFEPCCIVVTDNIVPPKQLINNCNKAEIPILKSPLQTTDLINKIKDYLNLKFAPTLKLHGTMVEVHGVGMLLVGESGVGKSESALDLLARGHRLIADDMVKLTKSPNDELIASSASMLGHFMEIRGIGIIDIKKIFGLRSITNSKKVDIEIQLMKWNKIEEFERVGVKENFRSHLGVKIPVKMIPLSPGKNITVITETIAMNYLLEREGYDSARSFINKLDREGQNNRNQ